MSTTIPSEYDTREQLARIDLALAESAKLRAEEAKLNAETTRQTYEMSRLREEARKLGREWYVIPFQIGITAVTGIGVIIGGVVAIIRLTNIP